VLDLVRAAPSDYRFALQPRRRSSSPDWGRMKPRWRHTGAGHQRRKEVPTATSRRAGRRLAGL